MAVDIAVRDGAVEAAANGVAVQFNITATIHTRGGVTVAAVIDCLDHRPTGPKRNSQGLSVPFLADTEVPD